MRAVPNPPAVVVHSGFDADTMRQRVMDLGAAAYVEKGGDLHEVRLAVLQVMGPAA
jgi:DNA-binding NarL/FixJ family response regulator